MLRVRARRRMGSVVVVGLEEEGNGKASRRALGR